VGVEGAQGGHVSRASYRPLKPSVVGYLTVRRAEAAVSASQPAEYHSLVMFFLNENLWPAMTLKVSLTAILLTTLVVVGWYQGAWSASELIEWFVLPTDPCQSHCLKQLFGRAHTFLSRWGFARFRARLGLREWRDGNSCAARIDQSVKYQSHYVYTDPALKIARWVMVSAVPTLPT
jgi:hypothetical protein